MPGLGQINPAADLKVGHLIGEGSPQVAEYSPGDKVAAHQVGHYSYNFNMNLYRLLKGCYLIEQHLQGANRGVLSLDRYQYPLRGHQGVIGELA
ncbi:hypothetical protein ES708_30695 [subsurface metagenome]